MQTNLSCGSLVGMFTGIIEATSSIQKVEPISQIVRIWIKRPESFNDSKLGDSIAVNGVCLTLERVTDEDQFQFALAFETLKVLGVADPHALVNFKVNLERALRYNQRLDGHLVTGHVDTQVEVLNVTRQGESVILKIQKPMDIADYVWPKGSCALDGVSLTINDVGPNDFEVCLIPETLKRTRLSDIKKGDKLNFEIDSFARGLVHYLKDQKGAR